MFGKKQEQRSDFEIFSIYDSKTQFYDRPIFAYNKNELVRDVINMFKDPQQANSKLLVNAEDYSIFKLGSYDKLSGQISLNTPMEHVANLHDLRAIAAPEKKQGALLPT